MNKVRYNLKNVHFAPLTLSGTTPIFGVPVPIPGAVSLTLSSNTDTKDFYVAGIYYKVSTNQGYEGDLETALIPDSFREYALNEKTDAEHVLTEKADAQLKPFALLFEFDGDENHIRHILYNCTAGYPDIDGATSEAVHKIATEKIHISSSPLPGGIVRAKTGADTSRAVYEAWFSHVYYEQQNTEGDFPSFMIDDITFTGLCEIERVMEVASSSISGLMLDGSYFNDVLGSYLSYNISLKLPFYDKETYDQVYELLTDPVDGHTFIFDYAQGTLEITGRVETVSDKLERTRGNIRYWDALKFTVIANHPSKQLSLGEMIVRGRSSLPAEESV